MQVLRSVPEQGQLAVVRQRRYVVTDVRSGVSGARIAEQPQHLVSLTSIEDDALGEELQVVWEIEPGARAFEKMELPEPKGFEVGGLVEAFRLGQFHLLKGTGAGLDLPDDLQLFTEGIVFDGGEAHKVLGLLRDLGAAHAAAHI